METSGICMAAATRPRGERAQLDIQRADGDDLISRMLPLRGALAEQGLLIVHAK